MGRKLVLLAVFLLLSALFFWFTLTSASPIVPQRTAPTAEDVGAGRAAYWQLRDARGNKAGKRVSIGQAELAGVGAVASHGFRPDALRLRTQGSAFVVEGSHHLPLGRWLNVTIRAEGPSKSFPTARVKIGAIDLPPRLSRWALELGRWYLARRVEVPPLDQMVRDFSVKAGTVNALVSLPGKSGLVERMAGAVSQDIESGQVVKVYCALAAQQRQKPSSDFAEQVHRAFSLDPGGADRASFNRATFVALGMLLVDQRVGDFAGSASDDIGKCRVTPWPAAIYGRLDWTKHWTLSAAISVGAGVQLSEAAGEWKELADSLARQSQFAVGDPSGFSMADLAADRAGFQAARAAVQPFSADRVAATLAKAPPEQLLPHELVRKEDGLTNAEFVKRYGSVDDPRFKARVQEIDAVLDRSGLR